MPAEPAMQKIRSTFRTCHERTGRVIEYCRWWLSITDS
jgi:hypothetical protein